VETILKKKWQNALKLMRKFSTDSVLFFTGDKESTLLLELRTGLDIPVIFVDTGLYEKELYDYLTLAEKQWGFKAINLTDEKVVEESTASGKEACYTLLKHKVVVPYVMQEEILTLIEPMRTGKDIVKNEGVTHVFPLSGFSDLESWHIIKDHELIYCELYNKGYREVGCQPCSKNDSKNGLYESKTIRKLKALGYL